jgi:ATP-dependent RNA helicase DDX46/PRP5
MMALLLLLQVNYVPIRKSFYTEVAELSRMSEEEVAALRKEMDGIKVRGVRCKGR